LTSARGEEPGGGQHEDSSSQPDAPAPVVHLVANLVCGWTASVYIGTGPAEPANRLIRRTPLEHEPPFFESTIQ